MQNIDQQIAQLVTDKLLVDEPITLDTPFADLDLDSLALVELSVVIERRFGVRLSESEMFEAGNVRKVAALVGAGRH